MTKLIEFENRTTSREGTFLSIQPEHVVSVLTTGEGGECGILTVSGVCYVVKGSVYEVTANINKELKA